MSEQMTRRNFGKAAGATAAGLTLALGWSPLSYAQNEKVRVALIGTGSQNCLHIEDGLAGVRNIEIVALADCLLPNLGRAFNLICQNDDKRKAELKQHHYLDYHEMLEKEKDRIDAVIIATPFKTHYQMVMDCLDTGKYVFCERTMAHTYEACRNIVTKCHETGLFVQVGHQRRYNPEFNYAASQMIEQHRLGRVTLIDGHFHRLNDWRRPYPVKKDGTPFAPPPGIPDIEKHVNWRVYEDFSTGLMSELCSNHVEIANLFLQTPPARVWGTGGIDYWRDGRTTCDNVQLVFEYDMKDLNRSFTPVDAVTDQQREHSPELNRPYTVRFTWSGSLMDSDYSEGMRVMGDKGVYELRDRVNREQSGCVFRETSYISYTDPGTGERVTLPIVARGTIPRILFMNGIDDGPRSETTTSEPVPFEQILGPTIFDKSPDVRQFEAFARHIKEGGKPRTNEMAGLMASVALIAAHEAVTTKQTVEIDPAVYTFDFETPDPFVYETIDG